MKKIKQKSEEKSRSKKAQIAAFVIIAIFLVAVVSAVLLFKKPITNALFAASDPKTEIQSCAEDAAREAIAVIMPSGGRLNSNPSLNYYGTNLSYLCYTPVNLVPCSMNMPILSKSIEKEIETYIKPKIESCFDKLGQQLERDNYKEETMNLTVEISPKIITARISKKISYTKNDAEIKLEKFDTEISSSVYDFIFLANRIINDELDCECFTQSCNADILKYIKENPQYKFEHHLIHDNSDVYSIVDPDPDKNEKFVFAMRNCAWTPD